MLEKNSVWPACVWRPLGAACGGGGRGVAVGPAPTRMSIWWLELAEDVGAPRLDRPSKIPLSDNRKITVGRGNADVLLDHVDKGVGMGRVHATLTVDAEGPVLHCHSQNKCRVEQRSGGLGDRNIAADHNARLTDGCIVIFASRVSRTEWRYFARHGEIAGGAADRAAQCVHDAVEEAKAEAELAEAEAEAAAEAEALSQAAAQAMGEEVVGEAAEETTEQEAFEEAFEETIEKPLHHSATSPHQTPAAPDKESRQAVSKPFDQDTDSDEDVIVSSLATPKQEEDAMAHAEATPSAPEAPTISGVAPLPESFAPPSAQGAAPPRPSQAHRRDDAATSMAEAAASAACQSIPTPSSMPLKDLRTALSARGINFAHCIEKQELVDLLRVALDHQPSPPPAAPTAPRATVSEAAAQPSAEDAAREGKLCERTAHVERLADLRIPDGVHLTLTQQPDLLSTLGRATLRFLCEIMDLGGPGTAVTTCALRASYKRLTLATHPDKARAVVGRRTARGATLTNADLAVACQRVNVAYELLSKLPTPFSVPHADGHAQSSVLRSAMPSAEAPPQQHPRQAQQQSWWSWWFASQAQNRAEQAAAAAPAPSAPPPQPHGEGSKRPASDSAASSGVACGPSKRSKPARKRVGSTAEWFGFCRQYKEDVVAAGFAGSSMWSELSRRYRAAKDMAA